MFGEQSHGLRRFVNDPIDIFSRIKTHIRRHAGEKYVVARTHGGHADGFTFQVADRSDLTRAYKLVAARMDTPKQSDRCAGVRANEELRDERNA